MGHGEQFHPEYRFGIDDSCLIIGGVNLRRLEERAGGTPFYAYDRGVITQRVQELWSAMPSEVQIHYAIKANPMPAVVQHLARIVDGLDVASAGEMRVALDTPMSPENISIAGPGKRPVELAGAIAAGVLINLESERELDTVLQESIRLGIPARLAIRVNPTFELKSAGMKMGGGAKQFGIDAERVPALCRRLQELELRLEGLHIYAGSQNLNAESLVEAQRLSVELGLRLAEQASAGITKLNIGGGFGIPYFRGDQPLDLRLLGEALQERVEEVKAAMPQARLILELGRYLVGEAGVYVCRVIDRKESCGQVFLVTDGGLHHHLAASGNFGQVIRRNFPAVVGTQMRSRQTEVASVVGPSCTPLDLLVDKLEMARADVGDLIVIFQSGAYGLSASPAAFLSHPPAVELLV